MRQSSLYNSHNTSLHNAYPESGDAKASLKLPRKSSEEFRKSSVGNVPPDAGGQGIFTGAQQVAGYTPRQVFAVRAGHGMTDDWGPNREAAFKVVSSEGFDVSIGIIIALNGVSIGIEVDHPNISSDIFDIVEAVFLLIFVFELVLKVYVFRTAYFRCVYHLLDVLIVVAGVAAAIMKVVQQQIDSGMRNLQLLKLARLLRLVRILRIGTQFRSLWIIVHGLASCMSTIFWTIVLVAIVCYIFAVIAVEFISSNTEIQNIRWDYQGSTVGERFADLRSALISLFEFFAIDKVSEKGFEVVKKQPWTIIYLISFVLLIPIVLLNLVTAVIVEMAISAARKDEEHHRSVELEEWRNVCNDLEALFAQMTTDASEDTTEEAPMVAEEGTERDENQTWMSRLKSLARSQSGLAPRHKTAKAVKSLTIKQDRLRELCNNEVVREKLNLLFAEPAESKRGMEKLMEYWPMLDTDADGELSLQEFTEGIGRLHRVIQSHSGDGFFWVRLIKELKQAQEQREAQGQALQEAQESRSEYLDEAQRVFKVQQERFELQQDMCEQLKGLAQSVQALGSAQLQTQQRVDAIHTSMGLPPTSSSGRASGRASSSGRARSADLPIGYTVGHGRSESPASWRCCSNDIGIDDEALHL